ncbi:MAG: alpha-L-rhamnosidase C-terminal domain-containing protein [Planctomycetota bacterium]
MTVTLHRHDVRPVRVVSARGIEHPEALLTGEPVATGDGEAELVVDFGRETVGGVRVRGDAEGKATLTCFYGEDLVEAMREEEFNSPWYSLPRDEIAVAPGAFSVTTPGRRAFRYVRMRIGGRVTLDSLDAWFEHYPVELRGRFACADDVLNDAWTLAEHTTRCCMQQYYEDGVKRDGLLWIGDYRLAYLYNAYLYGDTALAAESLRLIAATQTDDGRLLATALAAGTHQHPDNIPYMAIHGPFLNQWSLVNYTADFVASLEEYWLHSGDDALPRALWPQAMRAIDYLRGVDWDGPLKVVTELGPEGRWHRSPAAVAMHLLWTMHKAAALAGHLGDDATADACRGYLAEGLPRFRERYAAGACIEDAPSGDQPNLAIHATAQAVLASLAVDDDEARAWLAAADASDAIRPRIGFAIYYWLLALLEAGLTGRALAEMRTYYGLMLRNGATTCWEAVDPSLDDIDRSQPYAMSHCHAWTAAPAHLLGAYILGVRPAAPGFAAVTLRPHPGDLAWAEGTVPTPYGSIDVRWDRAADGALTGRVVLPDGVWGRFAGPSGKVRELTPGENRL